MKRRLCKAIQRRGDRIPVLLFFFAAFFAFPLAGQNNLVPGELDCQAERPPFDFTIQRAWLSSVPTDARYTPLCGDINGDGRTEVFVANGLAGGGGILYAFHGADGTLAGQINCAGITTLGSNGIALLKRNATSKESSVFIAGRNNNMVYLYQARPNTPDTLLFDPVWSRTLNSENVIPAVADLNGDGNAEIIAGRYILNANTGATLATLPMTGGGNNTAGNYPFPIVADMDKDGLPELIVGSDVYTFKTGFPSNPNTPMTPWKRCPRYGNVATPGANVAVDIDQDGIIDLVFVTCVIDANPDIDGICNVTVWTPGKAPAPGPVSTVGEMGRFSFILPTGEGTKTVSYPFAGDIDGVVTNGKKYPEICINAAFRLYAFSYNGTSFSQKWKFAHNDGSASTALTLYDFNQDGIEELIYRDVSDLYILNDAGDTVTLAAPKIICGSATIVETPIVADVNGDGSADILVTGSPTGANANTGNVMMFEGAASRWASCPNVWNQHLYSPLLVNRDLTIPSRVWPVDTALVLPDNSRKQYYNGGPMQAPYISADTYKPVDLSSDVYVVSGSIQPLSPTSVRLTVVFGNQGLVKASAGIPIRYYKDGIQPANLLGSAALSADLYPGQTVTIQKDLTGLTPLPSRFYVRILDDGANFPALGPFSDCNLTNNQKSFGTLELLKTVNNANACTDGTSLFTVKLINNTNQTASPQTFQLIEVTDSLGPGWEFGSAVATGGSVGVYNAGTRKMAWSIASIAPGDTSELVISAKALDAGAIRNMAWIDSVNGNVMGREVVMAYVSVSSTQAPAAAVITPARDTISACLGGNIPLTSAGGPGGNGDYQWYRNGVEILNATGPSYTAAQDGKYTVTYFDGTCVSQMSDTAWIVESAPLNPGKIAANQIILSGTQPAVLTSVAPASGGSGSYTYSWEQDRGDGVWTVISDATAQTYQPPVLTKTTLYRRKASDGCNKEYSDSVRIVVYKLPDNISDEPCVGETPESEWSIKEAFRSNDKELSNYISPIAGDIDGDGKAEIFAVKDIGSRHWQDIHVFEGTNRSNPRVISTVEGDITTFGIALAKLPDGRFIIVMLKGYSSPSTADDGRIFAYNAVTGAFMWKSLPVTGLKATEDDNAFSFQFVDFDGDGTVELIAGRDIFAAESGVRLLTSPGNGGFSPNARDVWAPWAADMNEDGKPDYVAGNVVYNVHITNRLTPPTGNTMDTLKYITPPTLNGTVIADGITQVADFNGDGHLDVLVSRPVGTTDIAFYVWDYQTGAILGSVYQAGVTGSKDMAMPFVGNVDDDSNLEVLLVVNNMIKGWKYRSGQANAFSAIEDYRQVVVDTSGETGITLFDFNQDEKHELVYRGEVYLYILQAKTSGAFPRSFEIMDTIRCMSGTHFEHPIVVDVDNEGSSAIVTVGGTGSNGADGYKGWLYIFKSEHIPWAPARKVWNQYQYNVVNVNEDLSIPATPFNPAMVFPNGKQPFNNFMQQQTELNGQGDPLWMLPDAKLVSQYADYDLSGDSMRVYVKFTNVGSVALQPPFYISVGFGAFASPPVYIATDSIMYTIHVGDTVETVITLHDYSSYGLPAQGNNALVSGALNVRNGQWGHYDRQECDYTHNPWESAFYSPLNDAATVQAFRCMEIDLLANDLLPSGYPSGTFSLLDSIVMQPQNGILAPGSTTGSLTYCNTGADNLTHQVDSFRYRISYPHPHLGTLTRTATVYIYILEDLNGASACSAISYTVRLRERPTGVTFRWWQAGDNPASMPPFQTMPTYVPLMPMSPGNLVWQIRPVDPNVLARWNRTTEGFPAAPFTVHVTDDDASAKMRWTGDISHDWRDPRNWVEQKTAGGAVHEYPVDWIPSRCTDVVIPSGMERYPELQTGDTVQCADITLEDRAMLKNPHVLTYGRATVEFAPLAVERDRFLTLSAPLMHMYTGDYHFKNGGEPQWGDVFMHFFRRANPDTGAPSGINLFTATFGSVDTMLYLGHAFNLHVVSTSLTRNQGFTFPRTEITYKVNGVNYSVATRSGAHRFITDEAIINMSDTTFVLPVLDDMTTHPHSAIQVVNPYMAYLDMKKFLDGNSAVLTTTGYYNWDGKESNSFTAVLTPANGVLIPPLRSFFVQKASQGTTLSSVKMSPNWTTTQGRHPYVLRADETMPGVLHIHAVMRENSSETILRYLPDASPNFTAKEDLLTLFYDGNPLTLYSFAQASPEKRPLALNASNDFRTQSVPLGLRLKESGEVTLEFNGLESFENIFLHDRERPNAPVNLKETPYYKFMANKPTFANVLELNDRFTLEMDFKVGSEKVETPGLLVSGHDGCVRVHATTGTIRHLQIYSISGALLHNDLRASEEYTIPLPSLQTYVVRALVGDRYLTEKVFVK